jgi:hypothetical protein
MQQTFALARARSLVAAANQGVARDPGVAARVLIQHRYPLSNFIKISLRSY